MNKNNIQIIKRIVANANLQNKIMIKKMDYNLNKKAHEYVNNQILILFLSVSIINLGI